MTKRLFADLLCFALSSLISFLLFAFWLQDYLWRYLPELTWRFGLSPLVALPFVLALALLIHTFLRTLYTHHLSRQLLLGLYIIYALFLIFVLFFKSQGISGINLNLGTSIFEMIHIDPKLALGNLLLFVPLGFLFPGKWQSWLRFFLLISLVEVAQYIFHLGFLDIGDILLNSLGFMLATCFRQTTLGRWLRQQVQ